MGKTQGQIAFEAYNESKGGLTYDGKPIPPWDELSGDRAAVHRAWEAAAQAVLDAAPMDTGGNRAIATAPETDEERATEAVRNAFARDPEATTRAPQALGNDGTITRAEQQAIARRTLGLPKAAG